MKPTLRQAILILALAVAILPASFTSRAQNSALPAQANVVSPSDLSHVRIVRLSFVEGTVTMHRADMADWAAAPANTPIQEGFKLSTAENSFAEVEFENTSTARMGQLSLLDFDQLAATSSGGKLNRMTLEQGYATFNVIPELTEAFEVKAQDVTVTFAAATATRFRIDIDEGAVRVEVFKGAAAVASPYGQQTLTPDMVAEIRPGTQQAFSVSTGITKDAWDQWVDERENQMSVVRNSPNPNGGSYYGWNDLSNYGDWSYFPGYGYGWIPGAPYGWGPYTSGQWCWYSGMGYAWISFEPWGWLPYHFGGWLFYPGLGWAWFPGSFGAWSPANVAWWQGQNGVGWSPLPPAGKPGVPVGSANCPHGQTCGRVIVRPETVQQGKPVATGFLRADAGEGKIVPKLDLPPSKSGMLPGTIFSQPASALAVRSGHEQPSGTRTEVTSGSRTIVVSGPGIVFNPAAGRYENNPKSQPRLVTTQPAPAASVNPKENGVAPSAPTNVRDAAAPGARPAWGSRDSAAPAGRSSHSEAPSYRPSTSSGSGWAARARDTRAVPDHLPEVGDIAAEAHRAVGAAAVGDHRDHPTAAVDTPAEAAAEVGTVAAVADPLAGAAVEALPTSKAIIALAVGVTTTPTAGETAAFKEGLATGERPHCSSVGPRGSLDSF